MSPHLPRPPSCIHLPSSPESQANAPANVLRYNVVEELKLGDFQLSQSYLFFYDKIEKANYYLEAAIELADEPLEGRLWSFLNGAPLSDGGQWDMAYNLVGE